MRLPTILALCIVLSAHHAAAATWLPDRYTTAVTANAGLGIPSGDML